MRVQLAFFALSAVALGWSVARIAYGVSDDYLGFVVGGGLIAYHAGLAVAILLKAMRNRPTDEWRLPVRLLADCVIRGVSTPCATLEFNENSCALLVWKNIAVGEIAEVTIHSPVRIANGRGEVVAVAPIGRANNCAYAAEIAFDKFSLTRSENDAIRDIAMQYAAPVLLLSYRLVRSSLKSRLGDLSGNEEFPLLAICRPRENPSASQKTVVTSIDGRGFEATLPRPYAVGEEIHVKLDFAHEEIESVAFVVGAETVRVGSATVFQHEFRWKDGTALRPTIKILKRRKTSLRRLMQRKKRDPRTPKRLLTMAAAAGLVALTAGGIFLKANEEDVRIARIARYPASAFDENVKSEIKSFLAMPSVGTDKLTKIYQAANKLGDDEEAAEAAVKLASRNKKAGPAWTLAAARHFMKCGEYKRADDAFDEFIAHGAKTVSDAEMASVYAESARAALALKDPNKSANRFLKSCDLKTADAELLHELVNAALAAKNYKLATQLAESQKDIETQIMLASVLETQNQIRPALDILLDLERNYVVDSRTQRGVARLLMALHDYGEAAQRLREMLKKDPDDFELNESFVDAASAAGLSDDFVRSATMKAFTSRRESNFQNMDEASVERLADALRRLDMLAEAEILLNKELSVFPNSRRLRYKLAQILSDLGRHAEAEKQFQRLLSTRTNAEKR